MGQFKDWMLNTFFAEEIQSITNIIDMLEKQKDDETFNSYKDDVIYELQMLTAKYADKENNNIPAEKEVIIEEDLEL